MIPTIIGGQQIVFPQRTKDRCGHVAQKLISGAGPLGPSFLDEAQVSVVNVTWEQFKYQ